MDLTTILLVNAILSVLGLALFVTFHRLDRIIKRKLEKKKADRKHTNTHQHEEETMLKETKS